MRFLRPLLLAAALALCPGIAQDQQQGRNPSEANYEFFSGTVAELPEGKVVVTRTVLGQSPENRSFIITGDTKVEGKLAVNARVTVGFKATEAGDVAHRIIVREQKK